MFLFFQDKEDAADSGEIETEQEMAVVLHEVSQCFKNMKTENTYQLSHNIQEE